MPQSLAAIYTSLEVVPCVGYPSKKMGGIIRVESCKVELPSILELEYSNEYEEDF